MKEHKSSIDGHYDGHNVMVTLLVNCERALTPDEESLMSAYVRLIYDKVQLINYKTSNVTAIEEEKINLLKCFGDEKIYSKEIPNPYWPKGERPAFMVTTKIGHISIHWRKSVIVIDWKSSDIIKSANQLFPNEEVTKDGRLIHAYTYQKATEYINTLLYSA